MFFIVFATVCTCIYTYIHTIYIYIYTQHTYTHTHAHTFTFTYTYTYICMHVARDLLTLFCYLRYLHVLNSVLFLLSTLVLSFPIDEVFTLSTLLVRLTLT